MALGLVITQFVGAVALVLAAWFVGKRKLGFNWSSLGWGTLAFPLSQVARFALVIPLQIAFEEILDPAKAATATMAVMVLTSGLFEESTRWVVLRYWAKNTRRWRDGVGFGLGHGGMEVLLLFIPALATNVMLLNHGEWYKGIIGSSGDAEAVRTISEQIEALQNIGFGIVAGSWYERVLAMSVHVAFTLIVLRAVRERRWQLWALAVVCHIGFNIVAVTVAPHSYLAMCAALTVLAAVALWAVAAGPLSRKAFARTATAETAPTNPLENETPVK